MLRRDDGLAVLVRTTREAHRPATLRNMGSMLGAAAGYVPATESLMDRMDWLRVPLAEAGTEVLIRAANRVPPGVGVGQSLSDPLTIDNDITRQLEVVRTSWNRLQREISHAAAATPPLVTREFLVSFLTDYQTFSTFNADHVNDVITPGFSSVDLHATLALLERQRLTLERWRAAFTALGGDPAGSATDALPMSRWDETMQSLGPGGIASVAQSTSRATAAVAMVAVAAVLALVVYEGSSIAKRVT